MVGIGSENNTSLAVRVSKVAGNGKVQVKINRVGQNQTWTTQSAVLALNAWAHVGTILQNGTSPILTVNGVAQALDSSTVAVVTGTPVGAYRIGASDITPTAYLTGGVQQVAAYNAALTEETMLQRYELGVIAVPH